MTSTAAQQLAAQRWGNTRPTRLAAELLPRLSELPADVRDQLADALVKPEQPPARALPSTKPRRGICAVCQEPMAMLDEEQTAHPGCETAEP